MKKSNYIQPGIKVMVLDSDTDLLAASGLNSSEGIGGGGRDSDGSLAPNAKFRFFDDNSSGIWNDEEQ